MEIFSGVLGIVLGIFGLLLCILWILLPFAVFAIRGQLDKTNRLLESILKNTGVGATETQRTNAILVAVHNIKED